MDQVSDSEWLDRQDLANLHQGQLPFLGSTLSVLVLFICRDFYDGFE